ncbi:MAG: YihY/virulence factor BrkB family protein [Leptolyngbyaceae cyanobacterium SM1_1_3]|nr:YihY/virulence factor BrkB family protein [Leptolyngbyaceae cyanobacterium SM1_1_3]NJN01468.1 YihY/virulence factor BrkB family protein [Leptolyngbyaceae cyanobacterium RM1_1_2]NJO10780.1 YihY/virulence factor BrkB family protein [Leptolyngbyaceae cyanobacterium SL_1_1]
MGASLAYYALFSLFPILLVMLSVMGFLLGPETDIYGQVIILAQELLPPSAFSVVETTLLQLHEGSVEASIVGFVVLLFTASGFFNALDRSFEKIWRAHETTDSNRSLKQIVLRFLLRRVFAFLLVIGSAAILLASMLSKIAIDIFLKVVNTVSSQVGLIVLDGVNLLPFLQLIVSFLLLTLVLMLLFKVLPPRRIQWRDVRLSGLLTALLLVILQQMISNSVISLGSRFKSYGVVGGVMVLMFWIYLTSQIFLLGGELSYVYTRMLGSRQNETSRLLETSSPSS